MKKIFLAIITAVVALTFVACNEGTTVKWTAGYDLDGDVTKIQWVSGGGVDQEWSETLNNSGTDTSYLGVDALAGTGDCLFDGDPGTLTLDSSSTGTVGAPSGNAATLEENAQVNLIISSAAKK
ncbi:MAG TPA: hypothetical protein PK514_07440 [Spirochaetota bacterium]|mgnify:CR=1 FL=1|nr:hypothetical protein [Spirochaetota bacterium]